MKALFIGGIKSGKSKNAELYALKISQDKPYYLATTEFFDEEMKTKVSLHKDQRKNNFITIEEGLDLVSILQTLTTNKTILVECVSMWINNMLHHKRSEEEMILQINTICSLDLNLIFVLNDVGCAVVSENKLVRDFVDISGRISQLLASKCDEVFHITAGIRVKIK